MSHLLTNALYDFHCYIVQNAMYFFVSVEMRICDFCVNIMMIFYFLNF